VEQQIPLLRPEEQRQRCGEALFCTCVTRQPTHCRLDLNKRATPDAVFGCCTTTVAPLCPLQQEGQQQRSTPGVLGPPRRVALAGAAGAAADRQRGDAGPKVCARDAISRGKAVRKQNMTRATSLKHDQNSAIGSAAGKQQPAVTDSLAVVRRYCWLTGATVHVLLPAAPAPGWGHQPSRSREDPHAVPV
jgi:hypothetical protein